ncbi:hypothetical protein KEM52_000948 [Ascosphaera acerosa]|nr:hypothetical protein KEM52_000948 [Ascosphaera acerosa]
MASDAFTLCTSDDIENIPSTPCWQDDVENFYSAIDDTHSCTQPNEEWLALPLCTAACNIGEESGQVRLLNPSPGKFATPRFTCSVHNNAILDLAFSASDTKLATASGDQTARVVDMSTQQTTAVLQRHSSSLKKVCWKDDSQEQVLATCSRDGAVAIWDLRVKCSTSRPVLEVGDSATDDESRLDALQQSPGGRGRRGLIVKEYTQPLNFIAGAHSDRVRVRLPYAPSQHGNAAPLPCPTVSDSAPTPPGDTSVTSLLFLPAPRSNLLVTSGASDACLRLWDLRTTYALRRRVPVPLAVTRQPSSHSRNRQFGITSMDLNTDGSRLYALCRDRTVYVYSTRHLAIEGAGEERLGGADSGAFKHFPGEEARMGLGPLYGLRHPRLSVSSFFVKLAVRREGSGRREVLAVGSSDNCAVVFSTDERYMRQREASSVDGVDREERDKSMGYRADATQSPLTPSTPSRRSTLRPSTLSQSPNKHTSMLPTPTSDARQRRGPGMSSSPYYASSASQRRCQNKGCTASEDQLPIYSPGVALSGAHKKEVSVVCFTRSGELITVSDDFSARCWREDSKEAWEVRTYGAAEAGGTQRHQLQLQRQLEHGPGQLGMQPQQWWRPKTMKPRDWGDSMAAGEGDGASSHPIVLTMVIQQPSGQIKFTNVSIVRLKKGKKRFELACYKNKLLEYRSGTETDLDNVLQIPTIFLQVSKGNSAPNADLAKAFGPKASKEEIIQEILRKGEIQVGERERKEALDRIEREVLELVSARLVDPGTKRVYTTGMISKALNQLSSASGQQQIAARLD